MTVNATQRVFKIVGILFILNALFVMFAGFFGNFGEVLPVSGRFLTLIVFGFFSLPFWFMAATCYWFYYMLDYTHAIKESLAGRDFKELTDDGESEESRLEAIRRKARAHQKHPSF